MSNHDKDHGDEVPMPTEADIPKGLPPQVEAALRDVLSRAIQLEKDMNHTKEIQAQLTGIIHGQMAAMKLKNEKLTDGVKMAIAQIEHLQSIMATGVVKGPLSSTDEVLKELRALVQ